MFNLNASGLTMLLKAMGLDPEILQAKAAEIEAMAREAAVGLQSGINQNNARLTSIELSLASLHHKFDMAMSSTAPAGESSPYLLEAPAPKETQDNGRRTTAVDRTHRKHRKAS